MGEGGVKSGEITPRRLWRSRNRYLRNTVYTRHGHRLFTGVKGQPREDDGRYRRCVLFVRLGSVGS